MLPVLCFIDLFGLRAFWGVYDRPNMPIVLTGLVIGVAIGSLIFGLVRQDMLRMVPEVPTIAEAGLLKFSILSWAALYGPGRMPRELTDRINKEFVAAMNRPGVIAQINKQAFALTPSTPEELAVFTEEQIEDYRRVLRAASVQAE